jgi:hypothetical protein
MSDSYFSSNESKELVADTKRDLKAVLTSVDFGAALAGATTRRERARETNTARSFLILID